MKKFIFGLLLLLPTWGMAQNHQDVLSDTARAVVDRYLQLLNIEELPQDSMLVMETVITFYGEKDTIWMRRWYAAPQQFRVEVWNGGKLETGLISNGKDRFRQYMTRGKFWESTKQEILLDRLRGYDFRGPLYDWRDKAATLSWNGTTTLKGQKLNVVRVKCPSMYERYYMFEPESGLLTLIIETENIEDDFKPLNDSHIEWKAVHEYQPIGNSMLPSQESFMRKGTLTILNSTYHFESLNPDIFEKD